MKFEVGEIAILGVTMYSSVDDDVVEGGIEVEVTAINRTGELFDGEPYDYIIEMPDGDPGYVTGDCLRKRRPPETPAEDQFQHDLGRWLGWKDRECTPLTPAQKAFVKQYGDIQPK